MGLQQGLGKLQCGASALAIYRAAGDEKQGAQAGAARQAGWALHQALVCRTHLAALEPHPRCLQVLQKTSPFKGLLGVGQAQGCDVPAQDLGARRQIKRQPVLCPAVVVA